jgi:hypothetical protein
MKTPKTLKNLEELGRVRLSNNFYFRDFLYSEVGNFHGIPNIPLNPELAIATGTHLCQELLEPLRRTFGQVCIRSGYRSTVVNQFCNDHNYGCRNNERNFARHIWDVPDDDNGKLGAMACVVLPWFQERYEKTQEWRSLAWWIHDNLPYSSLYFFPKLCAFNIGWHEQPDRRIDSYIKPKGCLTKPGMDNHSGDHSDWYSDFPRLKI